MEIQKTLYGLALLLACLSARAQKCDFLKNETDEFTGEKITEVRGGRGLYFKRVNDSYAFKVNYTGVGPQSYLVGKDDKLMLKLSDDSVLELSSLDTYQGQITSSQGITSTLITIFYGITADQIKTINQKGVSKVRIYFVKDYTEFEINNKASEKTKQAANCILTL